MDDYMMFKQSIRGFDKDEVLEYIRKQDAAAGKQIAALEKDIRKRDKIILELKNRIVQKDDQVELLEKEIKEKYQKYIDNYEQIGALVYESRIKGNQIVEAAHQEAEEIIAEAEQNARKKLGIVQAEIDAKLTDGKKKYMAVQEEMNEIIELFNKMQRQFMLSYRTVHEVIQNMPASLDEIDLDGEDEAEEYTPYTPAFKPTLLPDYDDEDEEEEDDEPEDFEDLDDEELAALLKFKIGDLDDDSEEDEVAPEVPDEPEETDEPEESEEPEASGSSVYMEILADDYED